MQQQNSMDSYLNGGTSSLMFPEVSPIQPWTLPQAHNFQTFPSYNPSVRDQQHEPFLLPSTIPYGGLFNRRMSYHHDEAGSLSDGGHHLSLLSETCFGGVGQHHHHHHHHGGVHQSSSNPTAFGFQAGDLQKMTAQEIMDAKALAASKSHSEAERRRRERINNHLSKLRSLLPNTTKTDKASLLAEVIQHVKELKRQTSLIVETSPIPTEMDELIVDNSSVDEDGNSIIKASLCCEDRSDLLTDLIKTLKAMRLRTLKAEIATMGGRVKNVLFITGDHRHENDVGDDQQQQQQQCTISSIKEALKAVMEKASVDESVSGNGNVKRQRTNIINTL